MSHLPHFHIRLLALVEYCGIT